MAKTKNTREECVVCKGKIVEDIVREFDPTHGPMIIGPGSEGQFHEVSKGYYCEKCGLKYQFGPPTKRRAKAQKQTKELKLRTRSLDFLKDAMSTSGGRVYKISVRK